MKINWYKVPFEILAMIVMTLVWGSKATHRMISSETKYQKDKNKPYVNMVCGICGKEACNCDDPITVPEKEYNIRRKI